MDDITPHILRTASTIEQWTTARASLFEDDLEEELAKYNRYKEDIEASEQQQEVLLESITVSCKSEVAGTIGTQ